MTVDSDLFNSIQKQFRDISECWDYHKFMLFVELLKESQNPEHVDLARSIGAFVFENYAKSDLVNHLYIERLGWKIEMAALARWLNRSYPFEWDEDADQPFKNTNWYGQVSECVYVSYLSYLSGYPDRARGHTERLAANQESMEDAFFAISEFPRRDAFNLYLLYGLSSAHKLLLDGQKNRAMKQIRTVHKLLLDCGSINLFQLTKNIVWALGDSDDQ